MSIHRMIHLIKELPLPRIIESYGVETIKYAKCCYAGICPFHRDEKKTLILTKRNYIWTWRCEACGQEGSVIDFMMKQEGLSLREIYLRLERRWFRRMKDQKMERMKPWKSPTRGSEVLKN